MVSPGARMGVDQYDDANSSWDLRKTLDRTSIVRCDLKMPARFRTSDEDDNETQVPRIHIIWP
jgi:hypothetical protein